MYRKDDQASIREREEREKEQQEAEQKDKEKEKKKGQKGEGSEKKKEEKDKEQEKKKKTAAAKADETTEHAIEAEEVIREQDVDKEKGLSGDEVKKRREKYGPNQLPEKDKTSVIQLFFKQFKDFLILILFIAAGISWYIGEIVDVYIILAVILFNAIMGFSQEYKAEKAIEAIKSMVEHKALVIRNGKKETVEAKDIVPGDIIVLEEGQTVPADARLFKAKNLRADESSLTGESEPVSKNIETLDKDTPLGDRANMVWKATHLVKGSGQAVVTATGKKTQIGKIARSLGEMEKSKSNFRKKTDRLAKIMAGIAIVSAGTVFSIGYFYRNFEFQEILMVTIATLVSSIPEGLPVVISVVLAIGAHRMAKKNAIIREFTATEELGSVTTILTDKTGTITQGVLTVRKIIGADKKELKVTGEGYETRGKIKEDGREVQISENRKVLSKILTVAAFCNQATIKKPEDSGGERAPQKPEQETEDIKEKEEGPSLSEKRTEQSHRRIKEDVKRLAEDIRQKKQEQAKDYEKTKDKDKAFLEKDLERLEEDIIQEVEQKQPPKASGKEDQQEAEKEGDKNSLNAQGQKDEKKKQEEKTGVKVSGDPTEVALRVLAEKSGIEQMEPFNKVKVIDDLPFSSENKFRATLVQYENASNREMLVVGAPEKILEISSKVYKEEGATELGKEDKEFIQQKNDEWADQALRILALAHKQLAEGKKQISEEDVNDLTWTGMVGIIDPARGEVKEAIDACKRSGIRVMMVTGDHKKTGAAIARDVGMIEENETDNEYPVAVSEKDIMDLDDEKFDDLVQHVSVFARVSPQTKVRIAESLQKKGELIAMTGDGVNDALALKKADVGIAMGIRGTDVAKDAAQIVLSDDNFASIVNAVREGRIIFENLKNTTYFLVTTNFAEVATFVTALLLGLPIPLTAVQILWVNLVTDGVLVVARSTEPGHEGIMDRKPIKKEEPILKWEIMPHIIMMAVIMVVFTIITFNYYLPQGMEMARAGAFLMISMTQVFNVFNLRDRKKSVFEIGFFTNKWINRAVIASVLLQLAVVRIPFLQEVFGFKEIDILEFLLIIVASSMVLWVGELYKIIKKRIKNEEED